METLSGDMNIWEVIWSFSSKTVITQSLSTFPSHLEHVFPPHLSESIDLFHQDSATETDLATSSKIISLFFLHNWMSLVSHSDTHTVYFFALLLKAKLVWCLAAFGRVQLKRQAKNDTTTQMNYNHG